LARLKPQLPHPVVDMLNLLLGGTRTKNDDHLIHSRVRGDPAVRAEVVYAFI
jgi:hypothetical protein